jgi:hypothetical protein
MNPKNFAVSSLALSSLLVFAVGCSSSSAGPDAATPGPDAATPGPDASSPGPDAGTDAGVPPAPTLGAEIDRMGRPAVNTALTDPFNLLLTGGGDGGYSVNAAKDAYNAQGNPAMWATFAPWIAQNLAILDGLDGVCGNQAFAAPANPDGGIPPNRYGTLAGVLADDELYVNTTPKMTGGAPVCALYLGVEANATSFFPNMDCGGRTPLENTIDETYQLLAGGLSCYVSSCVVNGVTVNPDATQASLTAFPYLAPGM